MNIIEKYSRSVTSSNLKDDSHHHQTDVLAAVALCQTRLATKLFRVKYAADATSYSVLLADWTEIVTFKSLLRAWPVDVSPKKVARLSLDHWLSDVCCECFGTGFELLKDVPSVLSDTYCKVCNGTSKRPINVKHSLTDYVRDMVESLEMMSIQAGGEAVRKLSRIANF